MPNEPVEKVSFLKSASSAGSNIRNYFCHQKSLQSLMWCSYSHDRFPTPTLYYSIPPHSRKRQAVSMHFKEIVYRTVEHPLGVHFFFPSKGKSVQA
jgi:hypothetical protein